MFVRVVVGIAGIATGISAAIWTSYASAPRWLIKVDDIATRFAWGAARLFSNSPTTLNDSILTVTANELKVNKLPVGYRYHALPYPLPARWDREEGGACEAYQWARMIPNYGSSTYLESDTTVDGMYGQFLSSIEPPIPTDDDARRAFSAYLASRKTLDQIEQRIRREAGRKASTEWKSLQKESEQNYLALARALQHTINITSGVYAKALADYANDGFRENVACGNQASRLQTFSIQPSLRDFRESSASRTSISASAELLELAGTTNGEADKTSGLGSGEVALSFRQVRIFNITPGAWFNKAAVTQFVARLRPDAKKFWGDGGLFPLMPVALLAVTEPSLKVKLSPQQALQVHELLAKNGALQVGTFKFDFSKSGGYRASNDDGTLRTEIEFTAPRGEVVILGVLSKRPDAP